MHKSPLVREEAIYGLSHHLTEDLIKQLQVISYTDKSSAVRSAAQDVLENL
jgi:hypothetical protein